MRPKARGLAQHGGQPDMLKESDQKKGVIFVRDGPLAPVWGADLLLNVHKTLPGATLCKESMTFYSSRPVLSL